MKNNLVTVSNGLVKASYTMSLLEKRLVLLFISMINNRVTTKTEVLDKNYGGLVVSQENTVLDTSELEVVSPAVKYEISIRDYADCYGIKYKTAQEDLQLAVDKLYQQSLCFVDTDGSKVDTRWISTKVTYDRVTYA